ncbi:MAG TPA: sigma-70 family RNA polymerase sigma factor [Candidatus Binatia bacterium]|jgi:RNA polymerase sigma factor (sigma-70 family)|nr:sigma-70 family RNA polymerase sigma factor [Candidatus Binatia bacterium]
MIIQSELSQNSQAAFAPPAQRSDRCPFAAAPGAQLDGLPDATLLQRAQAGDAAALDALLSRRFPQLLRFTHRACSDPAAAEDLCIEATLKAIQNLSRVPPGLEFHLWAFGFIHNEIRHWRRNTKKVGTPLPPIGITNIESMSVPTIDYSEQDLRDLLRLLWQQATRMPPPERQTAAFMLEYYSREQEFPPVRTIADSTHCGQGTAQRSRKFALALWRRTLAALGLHPNGTTRT